MINRNTLNESFSELTIDKVWEKGTIVPGYDKNILRKDTCGAWIQKDKRTNTPKGLSFEWEIDHIIPVEKGGTDDLDNPQPLQWENNRGKGEDYPVWDCTVSADGNRNKYN